VNNTDKTANEFLWLLLRFVLLLLVLKFVFFDCLPNLRSPEAAQEWEQRVVRPLDNFIGSPKPPDPAAASKPDDSWALPGESLIVAPNAPEGSFPMVEGTDGRLYQLTPSTRRPLSDAEIRKVCELLRLGGLERRPYRPDADGERPGPLSVPAEQLAPGEVTRPTVRGEDGRKYQLGPNGEMRLVP
jgi:hypothetical protein